MLWILVKCVCLRNEQSVSLCFHIVQYAANSRGGADSAAHVDNL